MPVFFSRRCLWLCLLIPLLAGCGVLPLAQTSAPAAASVTPSAAASTAPDPAAPSAAAYVAPAAPSSAPYVAPAAPPAPSAAPYLAPPAPSTAQASAAASAVDPSAAGWLEQAYTPLVLLQAAAVAIEEAARQVDGDSQEAVFARLIAVSVLAGVANAALAEEPPIPELKPVWEDARAVGQDLNDVMQRWAGQQITPEAVAAELDSITPQIETIVRSAEAEIATAYKVDPAELQRLREETIAQLDQALASAAPQASTAP